MELNLGENEERAASQGAHNASATFEENRG